MIWRSFILYLYFFFVGTTPSELTERNLTELSPSLLYAILFIVQSETSVH